MKKKLLALAIAGAASSGALAQMNVTISGNIDLSIMEASGTSRGVQQTAGNVTETAVGIVTPGTAATEVVRGRQTSMVSGNRSTSKVKIAGTEDLGSGLKLAFVVESGIDASGATGQAAPAQSGTSGAGLMANREASIALSDSWGTVKFGSFKNLFNDSYGAYDANTNTGAGSVGFVMYNPITSKANNSVAYLTPNISGFVGTYQVTMSENQDQVIAATTGTNSALMLKYSAGPLVAQIGQMIARDYAVAATFTGRKFILNQVGVSYDLGVAKLMGQYFTTVASEGKSTTAATAADTSRSIDANTWNIGATIPMGANLFRIAYTSTNDKRANNADATQWYLGYDYSLSKRTTFYAGAAAVNNKNGAMFSANSDTTGAMTRVAVGSYAAAAATALGGRTNAYLAGFNHTF